MRVPLLIVVVSLLIGCSEGKIASFSPPEDLIPLDSFAHLVGELQLLNVVKHRAGRLENMDSLKFHSYYQQACAMFNISTDRYERSYSYYLQQMDSMEVVFEKALIYLEQKDVEIKTMQEKKDD